MKSYLDRYLQDLPLDIIGLFTIAGNDELEKSITNDELKECIKEKLGIKYFLVGDHYSADPGNVCNSDHYKYNFSTLTLQEGASGMDFE